MAQGDSPQIEGIHVTLDCIPLPLAQFSELKLLVSTAWTENPRIGNLAGEVIYAAPPNQLRERQVAREVISQMLARIDPSIRIHLERYGERLSTCAWINSQDFPGGVFKMVAQIKVHAKNLSWVLDSGSIGIEPDFPYEEEEEEVAEGEEEEEAVEVEAEEVEQALMVSFEEAVFQGVPETRSAIKKVVKLIYGSIGDGCRETECIICLEDFETEVELSKMPCSHAFHQICLAKWFEQSRQCPVCRLVLPAEIQE